jgi:hypothetical protein
VTLGRHPSFPLYRPVSRSRRRRFSWSCVVPMRGRP